MTEKLKPGPKPKPNPEIESLRADVDQLKQAVQNLTEYVKLLESKKHEARQIIESERPQYNKHIESLKFSKVQR